MLARSVLALLLPPGFVLVTTAMGPAHAARPTSRLSADSAAVAATVDSFHHRMAAGDSAGVLALLSSDALVLESGGVESRDEYQAHHLPGDIAFVRAVPSSRTVRQVQVRDRTAWVTSVSESRGVYQGRSLDLVGAELVVLQRTGVGWLIAAVHWSSRPRASGNG